MKKVCIGALFTLLGISVLFVPNAYTKSYVNKSINLSFDIPETWTSEINGQSVVFSGEKGTEEWNTTLSLQYVIGDSLTLDALVEDLVKQWSQHPKYQKLRDRSLNISGFASRNIEVEYTAPGTSELHKQNQILINGGGKFYLIGYTAPAQLYAKHSDKLDTAITSLIIQGQTSAPKSTTAQTSVSPSEDIQAVAETLEIMIGAIQLFHETCSIRGMAGWKAYASDQVYQTILEANSLLWENGVEDDGWQYIFSFSSIMINKLETGKPVVGFYHPWSDTWIVTDWNASSRGFEITSVELLTGAWMRQNGTPPFDLTPDWIQKEYLPAESLARAYVQNLETFEKVAYSSRGWRRELKTIANKQQLVEYNYPAYATNIQSAWYISMDYYNQKSTSPGVSDLRVGVQEFLTSGSNGTLAQLLGKSKETPKLAKTQILKLSEEEFSLFTPIYWRADKTNSVAFLSYAGNPELLLSLYFANGWSGATLIRADLLSLPATLK